MENNAEKGPIEISARNARRASEHLRSIYGTTPILPLETIEIDGVTVELLGKFDNVHSMYTFKVRGAEWFTYNLMNEYFNETGRFRNRKGKEKPILITASAGNHAQGMALAANRYGLDAVVFMPESTPRAKWRRVKELGAEVKFVDGFFDDALAAALDFKNNNSDAVFVPPFENPYIMEGQATVGVEILSQMCPYGDPFKLADFDWLSWETPDAILCGLGGGGLASGMGAIAQEFNKKSGKEIKVIGVQTEYADSMYQSVKAGGSFRESTDMGAKSVADGIAVKKASERMIRTVMKYVDQVALVSEDDIKKGIAYIHQHPHLAGSVYGTPERETAHIPHRKVPSKSLYRERPLNRVEGAAAAPYAAVIFGDLYNEIDWTKIAGDKNEVTAVCVLTGSNISSEKYNEFGNYVKRPRYIGARGVMI